jgi:hypothetical protein
MLRNRILIIVISETRLSKLMLITCDSTFQGYTVTSDNVILDYDYQQ